MLKPLLASLAAPALLLLASSAAAAPAPAAPSEAAPDSASLMAGVDKALEDAAAKGFGGAVIIEQGGKTLLAKGYGFADRKRKIPFTPDTIAQIGSITKSQTGAALATLIAEGKVALSDPVSKFIPEAPEPGRSRTIAQLVSHTSGLLDSCTDDFDEQPEARLVSDCLARPLAHAPGEDVYSNMGYSLLALIVQRVAGKSWEDALRERVWNPLGMNDIGFYFRGQSDELFARGYLKNVEQPLMNRKLAHLGGNDWALRGNGGIQASSLTMIRFLDGILDPKAGLPANARNMLLAPVRGQSGDVQEGFGLFFRYKDGNLLRMGHSGSDGTFFSYLAWIPGNAVRFYFVGNNGEEDAKAALRVALKAAMDLPRAARSQAERG